jgi:hypothetical protein
MSTLPQPDQIRAELSHALQETDPLRPLDSLETTIVLAYFTGRGVVVDRNRTKTLPTNMEGWLRWADRHSSAG